MRTFFLFAFALVVSSFCETAVASTITLTPGNYTFAAPPTLDGNMVFVPAYNGSGQGTGITNGTAQTYVIPAGAIAFGAVGQIQNATGSGWLVYGNLNLPSGIVSAIYNTQTNTWTEDASYVITAGGAGGGIAGSYYASGQTFTAKLAPTGTVGSITPIPMPAGDIATTQGIFGSISTGYFDNGSFLSAYCADGGLLRSLGGGSSIGYGVNGSTGSCLGSMDVGNNLLATSWDTLGDPSFFENQFGNGLFDGTAFSGYFNLTLLEDPNDNEFVNNGLTTISLQNYCASFGVSAADCTAAYITGNPTTGMGEVFTDGPLVGIPGNRQDLNAPFTQTTPTPEPGTMVLCGLALIGLGCIQYKRGQRSRTA